MKSSLVHLKGLLKLVLFVACPRSSEVMPETWRQSSAGTAEGRPFSCVESGQVTRTVMEPKEDKSRGFCGRRVVKLAKYGFSEDFEGCRVAESGDEVLRPHGSECRECIRVARMCDDAGQQSDSRQQHRLQEVR